jgi:integrase
MRLTKGNLATLQLPPDKNDLLVFDDTLVGFGVRIRAGGKRTWVVQYRLGEKQRRLSLGSVERIDPDEARRRARIALSNVNLGVDPQAEKTKSRALAAATVGRTVESYLSRRAEQRLKPNSLREVQRYLRVHWAPIHETSVHSLSRAAVAARLGEIAAQNGPYAANRARAALSALYSWAIGEGLADANPVVGTNRAADEVSRDRLLSDDELRLIWREAGSGEFGAIIRLLVLTGQRREEVGGLMWSELDLERARWTIAAARTKNRLPHDVPLSPPAAEILRARLRGDERDLVFGSGAGPFQGWSNAKAALDHRMLEALGRKNGKAVFKPWRLHDIRRTVATGLGDMGAAPHVIESILNHISGHRSGVAGVYNRAVYAVEKREALDRWAARVVEICANAEAVAGAQPQPVDR